MLRSVFTYYDEEYFLAHHGIKGQKWGVRRSPEELGHKVPRSTVRMAKKDAKEFARAKMYYGEGAGNRRKLIKATVNERSKDPDYKAEFEKALGKQDMAQHAAKARSERARNTAVSKTAKTARGIVNIVTGNAGRAGAAAVGLYGAYSLMRMTGADKQIINAGKNLIQNMKNTNNIVNFDEALLRDTFR